MIVKTEGKDIIISGITDFDIEKTFDCGQCFRFDPPESAAPTNKRTAFSGVAFSKYLELNQPEPDTLVIKNCTVGEFESVWKRFLSLDCDYGKINNEIIAEMQNDPHISRAISIGSGIRILRQEPWEAVCSFIISQNNNIPRIKKIIKTLSMMFGEKIDTPYGVDYAFPTPEALYEAGIDKIAETRVGYRAKHIYDAAKKVALGETDLRKIKTQSTEEAAKALCEINGIGPKVAACALLFGFEKYDVFPVDVWMKKVLCKYYPDKTPEFFGKYRGIAQQYLFYYERYIAAKSADNLIK